MKLTEELKGKLESAKSEEEVKKILEETKKDAEEAGVILDDDELERIAGGITRGTSGPQIRVLHV